MENTASAEFLPPPAPPPPAPVAAPSPAAAPVLPSAQEIKALTDQALTDAKAKWEALWPELRQYVKDNPGKSILAALGVGLVLGLLMKD